MKNNKRKKENSPFEIVNFSIILHLALLGNVKGWRGCRRKTFLLHTRRSCIIQFFSEKVSNKNCNHISKCSSLYIFITREWHVLGTILFRKMVYWLLCVTYIYIWPSCVNAILLARERSVPTFIWHMARFGYSGKILKKNSPVYDGKRNATRKLNGSNKKKSDSDMGNGIRFVCGKCMFWVSFFLILACLLAGREKRSRNVIGNFDIHIHYHWKYLYHYNKEKGTHRVRKWKTFYSH